MEEPRSQTERPTIPIADSSLSHFDVHDQKKGILLGQDAFFGRVLRH